MAEKPKKKSNDPPSFGPFPKGINNVDDGLVLGEGELLHAVNLDIDRAGILTRREGSNLALALAGAHSLWARDDHTGFFAAGTDLHLVSAIPEGLATSILRAGVLAQGRGVAFVEINGDTYYSNGAITGKIRADNTTHPWGVEKPNRNPTLTAIAGSLYAGRYQVAVQFVDDRGEVSGMLPPVSIDVPDNSGIALTNMPVAVDPDVQWTSVFMSETNGDILYRRFDLPVNIPSATILNSTYQGMRAGEFTYDVMLPTDMLEYYNGRIYGAIGNVIWYTNALNYGLMDRRRNFILLPREVTILKAVVDGLFVGNARDVMFFAGSGPEEFAMRVASPYGAVRGTGVNFPKTEKSPQTVGWLSERGWVKGQAGGAVDGGEAERVMVGMYAQGAALYREHNGIRQVVGAVRGETREALVSTDHAQAEVRRNGIIIEEGNP